MGTLAGLGHMMRCVALERIRSIKLLRSSCKALHAKAIQTENYCAFASKNERNPFSRNDLHISHASYPEEYLKNVPREARKTLQEELCRRLIIGYTVHSDEQFPTYCV